MPALPGVQLSRQSWPNYNKIFIPEVRTLCILILEIQSGQILSHKKKLLRTLWVQSVSFLLEYVAAYINVQKYW